MILPLQFRVPIFVMIPDNNCAVVGNSALLNWTYFATFPATLISWYYRGVDGSGSDLLILWDSGTIAYKQEHVEYVDGPSSAIMNITNVLNAPGIHDAQVLAGSPFNSDFHLPVYKGTTVQILFVRLLVTW